MHMGLSIEINLNASDKVLQYITFEYMIITCCSFSIYSSKAFRLKLLFWSNYVTCNIVLPKVILYMLQCCCCYNYSCTMVSLMVTSDNKSFSDVISLQFYVWHQISCYVEGSCIICSSIPHCLVPCSC